jgi:hypothetical protein
MHGNELECGLLGLLRLVVVGLGYTQRAARSTGHNLCTYVISIFNSHAKGHWCDGATHEEITIHWQSSLSLSCPGLRGHASGFVVVAASDHCHVVLT